MNTKQVIVIRKDLNMRKGKMCAQASHASMSFLTKNMEMWGDNPDKGVKVETLIKLKDWPEVCHWLNNSFRKICVFVNSEQELTAIYKEAVDKGLIAYMVIDNGATEFNGVLTATCIAIGPHFDERFEGLTDHLPLL
jgi:PTH2 family peptidyl-tRNA hydrolase